MALVSASKRWSGSTAKAWGKLAGTCNQYLTKGQQVYVEGRLTSRTYQTRDGQTRYSNDVTVREIQSLGGNGADAPISSINPQPDAPGPMDADDAIDLPF